MFSREFAATLVIDFFVAFGVVLGGALIGGIGAFIIGKPPLTAIHDLAGSLKIWALVAAIGAPLMPLQALREDFLQVHTLIFIRRYSWYCLHFQAQMQVLSLSNGLLRNKCTHENSTFS